MKKWLILVVVLLVIGLGIGFYIHSKSSQTSMAPTVAVTKGTVIEKAQAIGYIKPHHSNTIKSSVNGTVMALYHDAGDFVQKGTPLAKIKPEPDPSAYAVAFEGVEESLANEKASLKDLTRYREALKTKLITTNYTDYIKAKQSYDTSKEKRILAQQKLALLDKGTTKVADRTIANVVTSPITGFILARFVDIGDPVISLSSAQASTPMFSMANMNDLMFEGSVDEMDAAKIYLDMPATIIVGAQSNIKILGNLSKIALQSDQENAKTGGSAVDSNLPFNVSFEVQITKLKLPNQLVLRSGYSATANIVIKKAENVLTLPERVLKFDGNKAYVLLAPVVPGMQPKKQYVKVGISDGMTVEITAGLKLGEKVLDQVTTSSK
ncbi:MAG: hypothetical protein KAS93_00305 [Gammaproteobacteria bacterium]|nr:hypothetical protein [Gammaproteobacteria bacterium]